MKIRQIAGDTDAAGCYRCLFPAHYLRERGHDIREVDFTDHKASGKHVKQIREYHLHRLESDMDMLILHMQLGNVWTALSPKRSPRRPGEGPRRGGSFIPMVYDCDDWTPSVPEWNPAYEGTDPVKGIVNRENFGSIIPRMTMVTCSTPFIAEQMSKWNKNVKVLRNRLHWPMWENAPLRYEQERDHIRIGWMGAFDWRRGDLDVIRNIVPSILRKYKNVKFVSAGIGSEQVHDYFRIPKDRRITVPGTAFGKKHMELYKLLDFDIGLIPLRLIPFNEAKSHLKGMDYNAVGIPFLASPSESYKWYMENGGSGFLVKDKRQWKDRLEELIVDEELRREMGRKGRMGAELHKFSQHIGRWEQAYRSVR